MVFCSRVVRNRQLFQHLTVKVDAKLNKLPWFLIPPRFSPFKLGIDARAGQGRKGGGGGGVGGGGAAVIW